MSILSKIKRFFGFELPSLELSEEKESEIIEKLARAISKWDMETPAYILLYSFRPISTVVSYTTILPAALFLEFFGIDGYKYTAFFSKKENLQRLLKRIEELEDEKKILKQKRKLKSNS